MSKALNILLSGTTSSSSQLFTPPTSPSKYQKLTASGQHEPWRQTAQSAVAAQSNVFPAIPESVAWALLHAGLGTEDYDFNLLNPDEFAQLYRFLHSYQVAHGGPFAPLEKLNKCIREFPHEGREMKCIEVMIEESKKKGRISQDFNSKEIPDVVKEYLLHQARGKQVALDRLTPDDFALFAQISRAIEDPESDNPMEQFNKYLKDISDKKPDRFSACVNALLTKTGLFNDKFKLDTFSRDVQLLLLNYTYGLELSGLPRKVDFDTIACCCLVLLSHQASQGTPYAPLEAFMEEFEDVSLKDAESFLAALEKLNEPVLKSKIDEMRLETGLEKMIQTWTKENPNPIFHAHLWFNLKGDEEGKPLIPNSVKWQLLYAAREDKEFQFEHLTPDEFAQLYHILFSFQERIGKSYFPLEQLDKYLSSLPLEDERFVKCLDACSKLRSRCGLISHADSLGTWEEIPTTVKQQLVQANSEGGICRFDHLNPDELALLFVFIYSYSLQQNFFLPALQLSEFVNSLPQDDERYIKCLAVVSKVIASNELLVKISSRAKDTLNLNQLQFLEMTRHLRRDTETGNCDFSNMNPNDLALFYRLYSDIPELNEVFGELNEYLRTLPANNSGAARKVLNALERQNDPTLNELIVRLRRECYGMDQPPKNQEIEMFGIKYRTNTYLGEKIAELVALVNKPEGFDPYEYYGLDAAYAQELCNHIWTIGNKANVFRENEPDWCRDAFRGCYPDVTQDHKMEAIVTLVIRHPEDFQRI